MKFYQDNDVTIYNEDCRALAQLPDESVQCVPTSPPYWGLRKYAGDQDLQWEDGWRGSFGLEPNPGMYVQHTVEILRGIRRVLRKDGVVFWNIGDSYANDTKWGGESGKKNSTSLSGGYPRGKRKTGLKPKDLALIPFRVAIAAQEDGWWVRSIIIWDKSNPMPESVEDRPTESHEYIIMLTKSSKYFWDAEAVKENVAPSTLNRKPVSFGGAKGRNYKPDPTDPNFRGGNEQWGRIHDYADSANGRNLRSVWTFALQPYSGAHFAVFPERLPEICIKAASPGGGCCSKCGRPWVRILADKRKVTDNPNRKAFKDKTADVINASPTSALRTKTWHTKNYVGWRPDCKCEAEKTQSLILDPFAGSGTTLWVAKRLGRCAVGYELSAEYCQLAADRNRQQAML